MKLLLIAFTLLLVLPAQAQTINDANAQGRQVAGFHGVIVSHAIDVYISQGSSEGVAVSAKDEKTRDRIQTTVRNGVLHISFNSKGWKNWGDQKLKAYVSVKDISLLEASGACDVKISGTLKSNELKLVMSGASDFEGRIEAGSIKVEGSGASDINIKGSAAHATIELSGASEFNGYNFDLGVCKAEISGASSMQLAVRKELSAQASGASSIRYKGEPVLTRADASGASTIKRKD